MVSRRSIRAILPHCSTIWAGVGKKGESSNAEVMRSGWLATFLICMSTLLRAVVDPPRPVARPSLAMTAWIFILGERMEK